ncbi:MAG: hypothetical protein B7C24_04765 [Bacteroidetes bacterium 4572_77]|nr:MAG: hypothetical protein B7C24_04765 [Bacteroidetes bacterium 4572_77]
METGKYVEVNQAFLDKLNLKREDVIGKAAENILRIDDSFRKSALKKLRLQGYINSTETSICTPNSVCISVVLSAEVITINKKEYNFTTAIDISDRINTEKKLEAAYNKQTTVNKKLTKSQEEVNKLRAAVEQSGSSIVITDVLGRIEYLNPQFTKVTGYKKEELLGKNPNLLSAKTQDKEIYEELWETISNGKSWEGEFHNKTKAGDLFWENAIISPVKNTSGFITHYIGIKENITAKKQLIDGLKKAKEEAEKADRLKSVFLANMSHEIRTPMNGILGFAELLRDTEISKEENEKFIKIIERSGHRLLELINNLIDISKIEAKQMTLLKTDYNIKEQLDYLFDFFKPEAEIKGLKLLIDNKITQENAIIHSDREKIFAILVNLIKNALKYTNKGEIKISAEFKDDTIEFYVKDTGIGIDKERQEIIFERFIQVDIKGRSKTEGAGLGLSITKAYVDMLNGEISITSKQGEGSCFYFTLPLKENFNEPKSKPTPIKPLRILVAEDDETAFLLIKSILKKHAIEILRAKNGVEALKIYKEQADLDLILMDVKMPIMNGYQVVEEIRKTDKDIIIIAQTAFAFSQDKQKSIDLGCTNYLCKPINKNELLRLINKYFS